MPNLTVAEDTFRRLCAQAAALNLSVDEFVKPALDRLADRDDASLESSPPLSGDAWLAELEAWKRDAEGRSARYPRGFLIDDSRESIYGDREDVPL